MAAEGRGKDPMEMTDKVEAYDALYERLMEGGNERYVPDGTVLSLAVYGRVGDRCADTYFLYATDYEHFSEPLARIALEKDSGEMLSYESTENRPFREPIQVPEGFYQETDFMEYAETYMNIREFVFEERLVEGRKAALRAYLAAFRKIISGQFESCYLELAETFLEWTRKVL